MMKKPILWIIFLSLITISNASAQKNKSSKPNQLSAHIDALIQLPDAYQKTPEDLPIIFDKGKYKQNPYFSWLTKDKTRAIFKKNRSHNKKVNLTILSEKVPIEEAVIDFKEGKFEGITISVFNRGDGGKISKEEFTRRCNLIEAFLTEQLDKRPRKREGNTKRGVMTTGLIWESSKGNATLVYNNEAPDNIEYLRLRFAHPDAEGIYEAALEDRSFATVRKSKLNKNLVKEDGNVYISSLPMVDQGAKGYCVVASAQRLFEYYGIACDMHQLAQIAKSDPNLGTSPLIINKQLGAIDYLFKTRFKCLALKHKNGFVELKDNKYVGKTISEKSFFKMIYSHIDQGIPLLWSLELGLKPETPNLPVQTSGGHMRMIIGYNLKENTIIFSDSWGEGHEYKTMKAEDLSVVTTGLFSLAPTVN